MANNFYVDTNQAVKANCTPNSGARSHVSNTFAVNFESEVFVVRKNSGIELAFRIHFECHFGRKNFVFWNIRAYVYIAIFERTRIFFY